MLPRQARRSSRNEPGRATDGQASSSQFRRAGSSRARQCSARRRRSCWRDGTPETPNRSPSGDSRARRKPDRMVARSHDSFAGDKPGRTDKKVERKCVTIDARAPRHHVLIYRQRKERPGSRKSKRAGHLETCARTDHRAFAHCPQRAVLALRTRRRLRPQGASQDHGRPGPGRGCDCAQTRRRSRSVSVHGPDRHHPRRHSCRRLLGCGSRPTSNRHPDRGGNVALASPTARLWPRHRRDHLSVRRCR